MNTFLNPFADSMADLFENGIEWRQQSTGLLLKSKVIASVATLDAPTKAAVHIVKYQGKVFRQKMDLFISIQRSALTFNHYEHMKVCCLVH